MGFFSFHWRGWSGKTLSPVIVVVFLAVFSAAQSQQQSEIEQFNRYCRNPFFYIWPAATKHLAGDFSDAYFDSVSHPYVDFKVPDGDQAYAIADGRVTDMCMDENCADPVWGCYVTFQMDVDGNRYYARYGCLQPDPNMQVGREFLMGDPIGKAGGMQDDAPGCRCRHLERQQLRFGLYEAAGGVTPRDVFNCAPNSCRERKENHFIRYHGGAVVAGPIDVIAPSNACGYTTTSENRWYAFVNISEEGKIDVDAGCVSSALTNHEQTCPTQAYDFNKFPQQLEMVNCFVPILKVYNDGKIECGALQNGQDQPDFREAYCQDPDFSAFGLNITNPIHAQSPAYKVLDYVKRRNPNTDECLPHTGSPFKSDIECGDAIVVGGEYEIIGVDDEELIEERRQHRSDAQACINSGNRNSAACQGIVNSPFNPAFVDYSTTFILARICDKEGQTVASFNCKTGNINTNRETGSYQDEVEEKGFEPCQWNIIDGGKFFDTPGTYIKNYQYSRFSSERGLTLYTNLGFGYAGIDHIYPEYTVNRLKWWNDWAAHRTLGCDYCKYGSDACTLGGAFADYLRFTGKGDSPYYPEERCGWWRLPKVDDTTPEGFVLQQARRADYFNPSRQRDGKGIHDFESGIPAKYVVNSSLHTIESTVWGNFIKSVRWKGPYHWIHVLMYNPTTGEPDDPRTEQDFLMPCYNDTSIRWECWWSSCEKKNPCVWTSCDVNVPGPSGDNWLPCASQGIPNSICDSECDNTAQYQCGTGMERTDNCQCWDPGACDESDCDTVWDQDGYRCNKKCTALDGSAICPEGCCLGAAEVRDEEIIDEGDVVYGYGDATGLTMGQDSYIYAERFDEMNDNDWGRLTGSVGVGTGRIWEQDFSGLTHCNPKAGQNCHPHDPNVEYDDWQDVGDTASDVDLSRDRYWTWIDKVYTENEEENRVPYLPSEQNRMGTRPRYETEDDAIRERDQVERPLSQIRDPGNVELLYRTLPAWGTDWEDMDGPRTFMGPEMAFNHDLRHFRQFNANTVWARTFKVTPEVNYLDPREFPDFLCRQATRGVYVNGEQKLGAGEAHCEGDDDCQDEEGTALHCVEGHGDALPSHCCEVGYYWDTHLNCCHPHGVPDILPYTARSWLGMNAYTYCEGKRDERGTTCGYEEGACSTDDMCGTGPGGCNLVCKDDVTRSYFGAAAAAARDNACCCEDQYWNGANCIPIRADPHNPVDYWTKSWTRTSGDGRNEEGGGPIWFHIGGGAMIPNMTEAVGWGDVYGSSGYWGRFKYSDVNDDPLMAIKGIENLDAPYGSMADKRYSSCNEDYTQLSERCYYCTAAWNMVGGQNPIWHETGRLSMSRDEYKYLGCEVCDDRTGCSGSDTGGPTNAGNGWTTIDPIFGESQQDGDCGRYAWVDGVCIKDDCTCFRDFDDRNNAGDKCRSIETGDTPIGEYGPYRPGFPLNGGRPWACEQGPTMGPQAACVEGTCDPKWVWDRFGGINGGCPTNSGGEEEGGYWIQENCIGNGGCHSTVKCQAKCNVHEQWFNMGDAVEPNTDILPESCGRMVAKSAYLPRYRTHDDQWGHTGKDDPVRVLGYPALNFTRRSSKTGLPYQSSLYPHPDTWIEYRVRERDYGGGVQTTCPGPGCSEQPNSAGWTEYPQPDSPRERKQNILPPPEDPWTLLRYEALPPRGHKLQDTTKEMWVEAKFHANTSLRRYAFAHQCMWLGCSMTEHVLVDVEERTWSTGCVGAGCRCAGYCTNPTTGDPETCSCDQATTGYPVCNFLTGEELDFIPPERPSDDDYMCTAGSYVESIGGEDGLACDPSNGGTCAIGCRIGGYVYGDWCFKTEIHQVCKCRNLCWGCWHNWHAGGHDDNHVKKYWLGYPATDDEGNIALEHFNEHAVVEAVDETSPSAPSNSKHYGTHLTLSKPIETDFPATHIYLNWSRGSMYAGEGAEYYSQGWIKVLARDVNNGPTGGFPPGMGAGVTDLDILGAIEITIPEIATYKYFNRQYPQIHDLTALWSAPSTFNYTYSDHDVVKFLKKEACHRIDDDKNYYFTQINPLKKYYYAHDQYHAQGFRYSWSITLTCETGGFWWFDSYANVGLLRNFHEDEFLYWDMAGIYPQDMVHQYPSTEKEPDSFQNVIQYEYSEDHKQRFDKVIGLYAPDCSHCKYCNPPLSTLHKDQKPKFEMCRPGVGQSTGTGCEYRDGVAPVSEAECKRGESGTGLDAKITPPINCNSPQSPYQDYCDYLGTEMYRTYVFDTLRVKYWWDGSECETEIVDDCEFIELEPQSHNIFFFSKSLNQTDFEDIELTIYETYRSIGRKPFE